MIYIHSGIMKLLFLLYDKKSLGKLLFRQYVWAARRWTSDADVFQDRIDDDTSGPVLCRSRLPSQ